MKGEKKHPQEILGLVLLLIISPPSPQGSRNKDSSLSPFWSSSLRLSLELTAQANWIYFNLSLIKAVLEPAVWVSPGSLLEMKTVVSHPKPAES